jgi:hypothetical protein
MEGEKVANPPREKMKRVIAKNNFRKHMTSDSLAPLAGRGLGRGVHFLDSECLLAITLDNPESRVNEGTKAQ